MQASERLLDRGGDPAAVGRDTQPTQDRECEIVLLCARTALDDAARHRLRELLRAPVDWGSVRDLAARHHTSALLYHHLSGVAADQVPADFLAELRAYYFHLAARNLRLVGEAASLLQDLEEEGAPAVLWKGPALAYSVYPSPELRTFTDIDIIVRRRDVPVVRKVMEERGYKPRRRAGMTADELFDRRGEVATMWHEEREFGVDVHWGATGRYLSPVMDCENLWRQSRRQIIGGATLRVLDEAWMLLALCAHGAKHGPFPWPALKWVSDFDAVARAYPPEAWEAVLSLARRTGSHRMLLLGLHLARELMNAPVPGSVTPSASDDGRISDLAAPITERLLARQPRPFPFSERVRFDVGIRERLRDRLVYTVTRAVTPSSRDMLAAPGSGSAILIPIRVIRLAGVYLLNPRRTRRFLLGSTTEDKEDT